MPIRVKVLYFGQARDASGSGEEDVVLPERSTLSTLLDGLISRRRGLERIVKTMQVAINEELAEGDVRLKNGDVVALLPPVAGG